MGLARAVEPYNVDTQYNNGNLIVREYWAGPSAPVYMCFFGGGWVDGLITSLATPAQALVARGITVLTPQYRVVWQHAGITPIITSCQDALAAYYWARSKYNGRVFVGGSSAGGHLAHYVGLMASGGPSKVVTFDAVTHVGAGGYSNAATAALTQEQIDSISPYTILTRTRKVPPETLIFHGAADSVVSPQNSLDYTNLAVGCGGRVSRTAIAGADHGQWNYAPYFTPTMDEAAAFIKA